MPREPVPLSALQAALDRLGPERFRVFLHTLLEELGATVGLVEEDQAEVFNKICDSLGLMRDE